MHGDDAEDEFGALQPLSASTAEFVPGSGLSFDPQRPSFVPSVQYAPPSAGGSPASSQGSQFSLTAAPFTPPPPPGEGGSTKSGGFGGGAGALPSRGSASSLQAAMEAPAFVPGQLAAAAAAAAAAGGAAAAAAAPPPPPEKMVQVTRNGCIFFVPESEALAEAAQAAAAGSPHGEGGHDDFGDTAHHILMGGFVQGAPSGLVESWGHPAESPPPGVGVAAGKASGPRVTVTTSGASIVVASRQPGSALAATTVSPTPRRSDSRGASLGVSPQLQAQLEAQAHDLLRQMEPDDERYNELPPEYGCACPLDHSDAVWGVAGSFGYSSTIFKVVHRRSGVASALRRVDGARVSPKVAAAVQQRWAAVRHSNVIFLKRAFVHAGATYFVHEYCPCARTALEHYFAPTTQRLTQLPLLPEATLWTHLLQLVAAVRVIHAAGLAARSIGLSRVLVTAGGRLRLGSTGVFDVLEADARQALPDAQRDDIVSVGQVILALATRTLADGPSTRQHLADAGTLMYRVRHVAATYSRELHALVVELLTKPPSVFTLCDMLSGRAFDELDAGYRQADALEGHVAAEVGAGRLLRLLIYLGLCLFNRPGRDGDPAWRETGDQYLLVLFCDFAFHQVDERNCPVLDHGHLASCLNKLDASDPEQILLTSRDARTIFVSSYAEVRRALDDVYAKLHRLSLS